MIKLEEIDVWSLAEEGCVDPSLTTGWTLYFDETNNYRKLSIAPEKHAYVNEEKAILNDFILGGIALPPDIQPDIDELRSNLNMPNGVELKSKHLFSSGDFLYDMGSKRVLTFLRWMANNPIYIHYFCSNNIYDAIIEVVDKSLSNNQSVITSIFHLEMKDSLYNLVESNPMDFLELLHRFDYPNMNPDREKLFCMEMVNFIEDNNGETDYGGFYLEMLRQNLKSESKIGTDSSLSFGKEGEIIRDYSSHYWGTMMNTPRAMHIFDHETQIERKLSNISIKDRGKRYDLFRFDDSKSCPYIQVADMFVGLLGKLFNWLDGLDPDEISRIVSTMNEGQWEAFHLVNMLIDRSSEYCPFLIQNMCPRGKTRRRMHILELISNEGMPVS